MPIIEIGNELRIVSTKHAWELEYRIPRANNNEEWRLKGCYTSFKNSIFGCLEALTRESSHKSYTDAQEEAKNLISSSLNAQNITVEGING
jgi:hypothetical protein